VLHRVGDDLGREEFEIGRRTLAQSQVRSREARPCERGSARVRGQVEGEDGLRDLPAAHRSYPR
jgi:hypothetical protein